MTKTTKTTTRAWFALLLLTACAAPAAPALPPLPAGFLLGVATAGFQNDPGCPDPACVDRGSDWYTFVTSPIIKRSLGAALSSDSLDQGPGSYQRYTQDFDLLQTELGGNAVRLSLEWSRLFPRSTALVADTCAALQQAAEPAAVAHYHAVLFALRRRGITPLVTLHHYTLPAWLHDAEGCHVDVTTCKARGWLDAAKLLPEIAKYARFAGCEFGGEVDLWATLNEPFAVILPGFLYPSAERANPPALTLQYEAARAAALAMIQAHARMYDALKAADGVDADGDGRPSRIGLVYNVTPAAPRDPQSAVDQQGARDLYYVYNEFFLNAVLRGDVDEALDGTTRRDPGLVGRMDYLGVNYYTRVLVDGTEQPTLPRLSPRTRFNPLSLGLWNDHPQGLTDAVRLAKSYGVPALITENGSFKTDDATDPDAASRFLVQHVQAAQRALLPTESGPGSLLGYFYWTLVDNYEWNHGMGLRFGLYRLQPDKARVARPAAAVFRQITQARGVSADLQARFGAAE